MNSFTKPDGLTEAGSLAFDIITQFLGKSGETRGFFYSPEEWCGTEQEGFDGVLIVSHIYDGAIFSWHPDKAYILEQLREQLYKHAMYLEVVDNGYSVVYHRPTSEQLATY